MLKNVSLLFCIAFTTLLISGCQDPTKGKPAAELSSAVATAPTATDSDATVYTLTDATSIAFVGSKVTGSHTGGFNGISGTVTVPGDDLEKAVIAIVVITDTTHSDSERLTGHLKSEDFFDVAKFPESSFNSTRIEKKDDGYTITGNLTLHGITKLISFPATLSLTSGTLQGEAEFSINRTDFGIVYPGKTDDLIREDVLLTLRLEAR